MARSDCGVLQRTTLLTSV